MSKYTNGSENLKIKRLNKQSRTELKWRLEPPQYPMLLLSISQHEVDELQSLIATGRKDFLWRTVRRGGNSWLLTLILCMSSALFRGWGSLLMMLSSLRSILPTDTTTEGLVLNFDTFIAKNAISLGYPMSKLYQCQWACSKLVPRLDNACDWL